MKLTCLSRGKGFHFPPCYILNVCGVRILLDCPLDLSALTIFSPVPADLCIISDDEASDCLDMDDMVQKRQKIEKPLDAKSLVYAEPWYKTVANLHLWNVSFIDIVLISSPMGMLGLPFLTRMKGFSAKIYVTEASARIGKLMMEDLVSMHIEFRQFYGADETDFPQWMKWGELELLPSALKEIALGKDGTELGGWMPLYSAADVKLCMQKVQTLRYAEETCYNGTLSIEAFSSGLEIGTCNWTINGPKRSMTIISSSVFASTYAMNFDYHPLEGNDLILYSDLPSMDVMEDVEDNKSDPLTENYSSFNNWEELTKASPSGDESLKEVEKLVFICSCIVDSVKAGGSVLIPIDRPGIVLQLLEQISVALESSTLKVPLYIISSVAEEFLAFSNTIPEWLSEQRQEKLFAGERLFAHVELVKEEKLHVFPAIYSPKLLKNWQEPCIVFSPQWSLRLGPAVHLLRRWREDQNSLLVLEDGEDINLALLPYMPMEMKVLQCSFLSGIKLLKVQPLLKWLQPKLVLFPEVLRQKIGFSDANSFSMVYYSENETLRIPSLKENSEVEIATDLASQFQWKKLEQENMIITRLKGDLYIDHGKLRLLSCNEQANPSQNRPPLHWGTPDMERLISVLSEMGINGYVEQGTDEPESENACMIRVNHPKKASIEVKATGTVISADDENVASAISKALDSILDGI